MGLLRHLADVARRRFWNPPAPWRVAAPTYHYVGGTGRHIRAQIDRGYAPQTGCWGPEIPFWSSANSQYFDRAKYEWHDYGLLQVPYNDPMGMKPVPRVNMAGNTSENALFVDWVFLELPNLLTRERAFPTAYKSRGAAQDGWGTNNHRDDAGLAVDGNVGFVDGHAQWRNAAEMNPWVKVYDGYIWW